MFSKLVGGPIGEFAQMNFNVFASAGIRQGAVRELPREVVDTYLLPFRPLGGR
jgi:haloalkane dehalogenase